jgi:hypothetical protein
MSVLGRMGNPTPILYSNREPNECCQKPRWNKSELMAPIRMVAGAMSSLSYDTPA